VCCRVRVLDRRARNWAHHRPGSNANHRVNYPESSRARCWVGRHFDNQVHHKVCNLGLSKLCPPGLRAPIGYSYAHQPALECTTQSKRASANKPQTQSTFKPGSPQHPTLLQHRPPPKPPSPPKQQTATHLTTQPTPYSPPRTLSPTSSCNILRKQRNLAVLHPAADPVSPWPAAG